MLMRNMKKYNLMRKVRYCGYFLLVVVLFTSCGYDNHDNVELKNELQKICEQAYFEGQKDALNCDIRIKLTSDSIYVWNKSCWDDGSSPLYNPTYLESKNPY